MFKKNQNDNISSEFFRKQKIKCAKKTHEEYDLTTQLLQERKSD